MALQTLAQIRAEIEAGWALFDQVFAGFDERQWNKKFGKSWTYAWIPYHLAYFDATAAKYVALGPNVPDAERLELRTMQQVNAWNAREFSKRPPGYTAQDALAAMRAARDQLRRAMDGMTDADLDRPAWIHLIFGWGKAGDLLKMVVVHNVAEYWKLWIRTGKHAPAPSPVAVHTRLSFMMQFMPASLNRQEAQGKPFKVVWDFEGPGGGQWTFDVANGRCTVTEAADADANLRIRMKPENFHKLVAKMTPPPLLLLTGQMKVKGFGAMGRFGKLFPEPKPDQVIEPPAIRV